MTIPRGRKLDKAWRLFDAGFLFGAADIVRKEREGALAARAEDVLGAIEQLTDEMRVRLSDAQRIQFDEWIAPQTHFEPRPITRSELKRAALVLAAAAFLLLAAFVLPHGVAVALGIVLVSVFSFVPMYVANRLGEVRGRRGQWIWGAFLGWIGVLVVLLRPQRQALPAGRPDPP